MAIEWIMVLLALGAVVGTLAGLLGIGGGLLIVPALLLILPKLHIAADNLMQVSLATSLATIIITSGSSALNHIKAGNVNSKAVQWLAPGMLLGGFCGSFVAEYVPSQFLPKIFACIVLGIALQMLLSLKKEPVEKAFPNRIIPFVGGVTIGVISSLAGIGGGSLSVPFLNQNGVCLRKAVGTSSVCGCLIATAGMCGFILHGSSVAALPNYSLGYVYMPALLAISCTSMFTTRIGVKLTSHLPIAVLKKFFALFLVVIAGTMLL